MRGMSPNRRASLGLRGKIPTRHRSAETYVDLGLKHKNWLGRWRAIQVITQTQAGTRADPKSIRDLTDRLSDDVAEVRFSALEALVELCPRGNSMATEAVEKLLKDGWEVIRSKAAESLASLASIGSESAVRALIASLSDSHAPVRRAALGSLCTLGTPGHHALVRGAVARLQDTEADCRQAAMGLLQLAAPKGDPLVLEGVRGVLSDSVPRLRQRAARYLSHSAAHPAHPTTTNILVGQLRSPERNLHRVALLGMLSRLEGRGAHVRSATLQSLTSLPAARASAWRSTMAQPRAASSPDGAGAKEEAAQEVEEEVDERALAEEWAAGHWELSKAM